MEAAAGRRRPAARVRGIVIGLLVALGGCAERWHGGRDSDGGRWPWAEPRDAYVRRSQVWLGRDLASWVAHMRSLDLLSGPAGEGAFRRDELVRCAFVKPEPGQFSGGRTPKFLCRRGDDTFKVKWGEDNGEIHAEVAGTRLFWALGFGADGVYPVRVECSGCAPDPWRDQTFQPGAAPRLFDPAVVERQFAGRTIEQWPHQGWTWAELDGVDPAAGGAPRAHVDAFKLLAAFIEHRDSKADNQGLVCLPGGEPETRSGGVPDCRRPFMLIDDFGSAFGGPSLVRTHKMSLADWERRPVWKDARHCIAAVTGELDARDGLDRPHIGEDGRRFAAALLSALDDAQIRALFTAARVDRRGGVERWVRAFVRRREDIVHPVPGDPAFRCP